MQLGRAVVSALLDPAVALAQASVPEQLEALLDLGVSALVQREAALVAET